jgi:hypothetical protein
VKYTVYRIPYIVLNAGFSSFAAGVIRNTLYAILHVVLQPEVAP